MQLFDLQGRVRVPIFRGAPDSDLDPAPAGYPVNSADPAWIRRSDLRIQCCWIRFWSGSSRNWGRIRYADQIRVLH